MDLVDIMCAATLDFGWYLGFYILSCYQLYLILVVTLDLLCFLFGGFVANLNFSCHLVGGHCRYWWPSWMVYVDFNNYIILFGAQQIIVCFATTNFLNDLVRTEKASNDSNRP